MLLMAQPNKTNTHHGVYPVRPKGRHEAKKSLNVQINEGESHGRVGSKRRALKMTPSYRRIASYYPRQAPSAVDPVNKTHTHTTHLVSGEGDSERLPQRVLRNLLLDEVPKDQ